MDTLIAAAGGAGGAALGAGAASLQHFLYRQREYRDAPARGSRRVVMLVAAAIAAGVVSALALRPDHYDPGPGLLTAAFGIVLVVLASTDFERRILPNRLVYPSIVVAAALSWAWPDRSVTDIWVGVAIVLPIAALLWGAGQLFGSGLGLGDVKLALLIAMLLGWPAAMYGLFLGILIGGLPALFLLVRRSGQKHYSYGPYLALGALVVLLFPKPFM